MENTVITAQQLLKKYGLNSPTLITADTAEALMIEFAKIHVDEALTVASRNLTDCHSSLAAWKSNRDEILEAYPLSNIKKT